MMPSNFSIAVLVALGLLQAGCSRSSEPAAQPSEVATPPVVAAQPGNAVPAPNASVAVPAMTAPALTPEAEKGEKGARKVLFEWARAVELRDFARAAVLWGENQGLSAAAHRARFGPLGRTTVSFGDGFVEGGAGSLYYEVPLTVSGGGKTLQGKVVVRRVNDVDGASPAQLRWHLERLELQR
jgi:hypothetical protein